MIDYNAAAKAMRDEGWTCDGHEPDEYCDICDRILGAGVRAIVKAALGDEPLYREATNDEDCEAWAATDAPNFTAKPNLRLVRVWPDV